MTLVVVVAAVGRASVVVIGRNNNSEGFGNGSIQGSDHSVSSTFNAMILQYIP